MLRNLLFLCRQRSCRAGRIHAVTITTRIRRVHHLQQRHINNETKVLLCGDGDLSYGASAAQELAQTGTHLTATVLEPQREHLEVYSDSNKNAAIIQSYGHTLRFETDATLLGSYDDLNGPFDRIQFNFPHWRGKTNARRNRKLLSDFFASAKTVLHPNGQVHVALMDHQGGALAKTLTEWKQSWMAARYAAEHDLLLVDVLPFEPTYRLSSYQWRDRPFRIRGEPQLYIFCNAAEFSSSASCCRAPRHLQLYCYYEIYTQHPLDDEKKIATTAKKEQPPPTAETNFLQNFAQERLVDEGWRAEVRFARWIDARQTIRPEDCLFAAYKIIFCGEEYPMKRHVADLYRVKLQEQMLAHDDVPLVSRGRWCISNVSPYSLLQQQFIRPVIPPLLPQ